MTTETVVHTLRQVLDRPKADRQYAVLAGTAAILAIFEEGNTA